MTYFTKSDNHQLLRGKLLGRPPEPPETFKAILISKKRQKSEFVGNLARKFIEACSVNLTRTLQCGRVVLLKLSGLRLFFHIRPLSVSPRIHIEYTSEISHILFNFSRRIVLSCHIKIACA